MTDNIPTNLQKTILVVNALEYIFSKSKSALNRNISDDKRIIENLENNGAMDLFLKLCGDEKFMIKYFFTNARRKIANQINSTD